MSRLPNQPPKPPLAPRPPRGRRPATANTVFVDERRRSNWWKVFFFIALLGAGGVWAVWQAEQGNAPLPVVAVETSSTVPLTDMPDPTGAPPPEPEEPPEEPQVDNTPKDFVLPENCEPGDTEDAPKIVPKKRERPKKPRLIRKEIKRAEYNPGKVSSAKTTDTMIVYTTELLNDTFGGDHHAMLAHFDKIIDYSNKSYADRGYDARLRLVGLVETEDVVPMEGDQCKTALGLLADNKIKLQRQDVRKLRDKCGADTVTYIFRWNKGSGGGLASVYGAWAAINWPSDAVYHHEMRHNGGWNHGDEENWSMIEDNAKSIAKWKSKRVGNDRIYVQYWGTGDEFDPPAEENK